jgi:hypothetical protein
MTRLPLSLRNLPIRKFFEADSMRHYIKPEITVSIRWDSADLAATLNRTRSDVTLSKLGDPSTRWLQRRLHPRARRS